MLPEDAEQGPVDALVHLMVVLEQLFAARVVTDQLSVAPPTVTVAERALEKAFADVNLTRKLWPLVIVPDVAHAPPLMETVGLPVPLTDTAVAVLIPLIVRMFE